MSAAGSKCSKCGDRVALVGSRCVHCYADRYARRIRVGTVTLRSRKWWQVNAPRFEAALAARLMAVAEGVEPGPKEEIVHIFWMTVIHPYWYNKVPANEAITKIIDGAEAVVRGEWEWRKRT